ncbi:MAG: ABC transporter permease [Terracidiphilus sp.]|jgi:predicted permease
MRNLWHDIRYALRQLRKAPGFTLTVTITLALGIGANTAIFTLIHGILLRSLPVTNAAQLYRIGDDNKCCVDGGFPEDAATTGDYSIFSFDLYQHLKASAPEFEQLAAVQAGDWRWSVRRGDALPKSVHGEMVSGNYFSTLGLSAYAGRLFADRDDAPSAPPTVVMSYPAWQSEYASDPSIVNSTIYIQAKPFTVIGVTPPGFFGDRVSDTPPDFWIPINTEPYLRGTESILHHAESNWLYPIGKVRPGTNIPGLQAKLSGALRQWLLSRPNMMANGGAALVPRMHVVLTPGGGGIQILQNQTGKGLKLLMILSAIVLLIACANIANLMLARATTQRSEIAVRVALGAGRRRVIRQILTESVLLSLLGGLVGLAVAYAGSHALLALAFPYAHNTAIEANPSLPVLGFAFVVSLLTGILFGVGPAWLSSHAQPAEALRGVNRTTRDRSSLPQQSLVVFQAALSVVLLAAAILMTKSLVHLQNQDFGVVTTNRYVVHFDPAGAGYNLDRLPALYRQIEDRFSAQPGVANMSLSTYSPLEGDNWGECVIQQGHGAPHAGDHCGATWDRVSPGFLDAVGVPMVRGRNFTDQDTATSPMVAIANQTFVKQFFPNQDPIGQHFGIDVPQYSGSFEIVGVFHDFKMNNPEDKVRPVFLRPLPQFFAGYKEPEMISTESQSMMMQAMILAFDRPQQNVDALVRRTLAGIDPNLTVMDLRSFSEQVAGNFIADRLFSRLTSLFGVLALILATVGLYGVMSYFVARRTSEIGIRMALGATRQSVVAMVMRGALWQILIGLVLGIPASLYAGYLMKVMLYGVDSYDPMALTGAPLMLVIFAAAAAFVPARRAASIEPMQALRIE